MKTPRFLGIREIITAIPVLLTIAAAGYVIYRHRVIPFQETDLLVWILALLGLLALGEMVQRYTSLILIERKLSSL